MMMIHQVKYMILWFKHIKKPRPVSSERGWSRESQFFEKNSVSPLLDCLLAMRSCSY